MLRLAAAVIALAAIPGGFFLFSGNTYTVRFSEDAIVQALDTRLPLQKTYYAIFDVTIDEPRVDLIDNSDRVFGGVDINIEVAAAGRRLPMSGSVDVSGAVDYDPQQAAFFLIDPRVEALNIDRVPDSWADRSRSAVTLAIKEFYKTRPIYTLEGEAVSKKAARMVLRDVVVEDERVVVTL
ncbi:MAG: DUF1439 domain-containing protein, partial [Pseudomonadota bacterium]